MTILVQDTARNNLASWTERALNAGSAAGAILSPFASPQLNSGYKQSALQTTDRIRQAGGTMWFDAETHALQMPNVGDFRYYDDWPLWSGSRGQLATDGDRREHIRHVFAVQDALGVAHLAPTILLHAAQSNTSQQALRMAEIAAEEDPNCFITIAGSSAFWAGGSALDAHVGGLAQIEPKGWFLTPIHSAPILPVPVAQEETHGLCRTTRSLSEDGPVHISYGDLTALPMVVAGATSVGSGWDPRQRVCAYANYVERETSGEGGGGGAWFQQTTFEGLLSLVGRGDAQLLASGSAALVEQLLPGQLPPGPQEVWDHHARVLKVLASALQPAGKSSYEALLARYEVADTHWATIASALGWTSSPAGSWVSELRSGLARFAATEGW